MGFEIINKLKKEKGLTNAQIAALSGVTLSTLDKITSGVNTNPKLDTLQAICRVLGCRLDDFDSGQQQKKSHSISNEALKLAKDFDALDTWGKQLLRTVADRELERVSAVEESVALAQAAQRRESTVDMIVYTYPAAAGVPLYAEDDYERIEYPESEVPRGTDFGIRISGNSMEPTIPNESIVWVRRTGELQNGQIGIFMINDESVCKRFYKRGDEISLESDNPDYKPIVINDFERFGVVGKVLNYR